MATDRKDQLKGELEALLEEVKELLVSRNWNQSDPSQLAKWNLMVEKARELHAIVKPRHHKYMIQNRECQPDDPEFYNHIHPIEDLIKFVNDPNANDDPEDVTIGESFTLEVFSRRWGHTDDYKIKRTSLGWALDHFSYIAASCDKSGRPFLYKSLDHDSINYPEALPDYLSWLWEQAAERGLTTEQVQESFNLLGKWISACERASPSGIWEAFK